MRSPLCTRAICDPLCQRKGQLFAHLRTDCTGRHLPPCLMVSLTLTRMLSSHREALIPAYGVAREVTYLFAVYYTPADQHKHYIVTSLRDPGTMSILPSFAAFSCLR